MADLRRKLARLREARAGGRLRDDSEDARSPRVPEGAAARRGREGYEARIREVRSLLADHIARDRRREARTPPRAARNTRPPCALPGAVEETPHGQVHRIVRHLEPRHHHGLTLVSPARHVDAALVSKLALDPGLAGVDFGRVLFIDTETTGLAGGMGTIPFLVGMARFEDDSLFVEQLFLRRPGEEAPMLGILAERLAEASCLVSYNGKSFDWPLLRNRFVLNRVPMPAAPPHLDLLHAARRLYKRRLGRVRLLDMETELLGMHREDDVPGALIPSLYLAYLRGAEEESAGLVRVLEHNGDDLVALAALLHHLVTRFAELDPGDEPDDHLSYAEVASRAGDAERARAFAEAAVQGGGSAACTVRALMLKARLARRRGAVDEEREALEAALETAEPEARPPIHLALAKLHEHRTRDPARALSHARHTGSVEGDGPQARRVARLVRRLERT